MCEQAVEQHLAHSLARGGEVLLLLVLTLAQQLALRVEEN
jgi:hypothetical protein